MIDSELPTDLRRPCAPSRGPASPTPRNLRFRGDPGSAVLAHPLTKRPIRFTPVTPKHVVMPSRELIDGDLAGGDGLLEKSEEEQATVPGTASVEAEGELVEVVVEVVDSHRALVGTQQPALKQRGDTM